MLAARETQDRVFSDAAHHGSDRVPRGDRVLPDDLRPPGPRPRLRSERRRRPRTGRVRRGGVRWPADRTHRGVGLRLPRHPRRGHLRSGRRGHHRPRRGHGRAARRPRAKWLAFSGLYAIEGVVAGYAAHSDSSLAARTTIAALALFAVNLARHEPRRRRAPHHAAGRPDPHHRRRRLGRRRAGRADRHGPRLRLPPRRHRQPAAGARAGARRAPAAAPLPRDGRPLDAPLRGQHDLRPLARARARRAGRAHGGPLGRRRRLRPRPRERAGPAGRGRRQDPARRPAARHRQDRRADRGAEQAGPAGRRGVVRTSGATPRSASRSPARHRSSPRSRGSSGTTTSAPTAVATPTGWSATASRWRPPSSASPTPTTP